MEEVLYINILKTIGLIASIAGIIIGIDLILGARVTFAVKRILEQKSYDFDKALKKVSDKLNQPAFELDKLVSNPRIKIILGIIFFGFSLLILLLIRSL